MAAKKYKVIEGDTIDSIAGKSGTTADVIAKLNSLDAGAKLSTGSLIDLPDDEYKSPYRGYAPSYNPASSTSEILKALESSLPTYQSSDAVKSAAEKLGQLESSAPGEYESTYRETLEALLQKALSRGKFSYDYTDDPMYSIYRDSYERQGKLAMLDAVESASALSGGYSNSYAVTSGSQAYQGYLEKLNSLVPELYDRAYSSWRDEGDDLYRDIGTLSDLDDADYSRYHDTVTRYYDDLKYYYTKYSDMSKAEYESYRDNLSAWESDREYWYGKYSDELALASAGRSGSGGSGRSSSSTKRSSTSSSASYVQIMHAACAMVASGKTRESANSYLMARYRAGDINYLEYQQCLAAVKEQKGYGSGGASLTGGSGNTISYTRNANAYK